MQVGLLADVHGNVVALDAVLEDMPPVDAVVCAGDVVGYNPWHGKCVDRLREREVPTVMGNHDYAVAKEDTFAFNSMAAAGVEHAIEDLSPAQHEWLRGLPDERTEFDGRLKIVHGHPNDPDHYTYPAEFSPRLLEGEDVLLMGHTHVQHHEVYEDGTLVNPGSVGQPRDGDPRAAYAVVDLADGAIEEYRVEYDVEAVIDAVGQADLPERIGTRLEAGT